MEPEDYKKLKDWTENYNRGLEIEEVSQLVSELIGAYEEISNMSLHQVIEKAGGTVEWLGERTFTLTFPPRPVRGYIPLASNDENTYVEELRKEIKDSIQQMDNGQGIPRYVVHERIQKRRTNDENTCVCKEC